MGATVTPAGFEFRCAGHCPICDNDTEFVAIRATPLGPEWYPGWFRGGLLCRSCGSIPRERALFSVVERLYPNWRELRIHESSPADRGASRRFRWDCAHYTASQFDPGLEAGAMHPSGRYQSQDLERQSFADDSFDIVITQDVFEHLFFPDRAIAEIARTLRPGGAHIFTVPLVNQSRPSTRRARREPSGEVVLLDEAQYHGNPVSARGSLVTVDWGFDIVDYLALHSGLSVSMFYIDDLSRGIRAAHSEVFACRKAAPVPAV